MPKLQVTFFRHRTRPGVLAVSPVSTNLVFLEPDDWESDRQEIIDPDRASTGSEGYNLAGSVPTTWLLRLGADATTLIEMLFQLATAAIS